MKERVLNIFRKWKSNKVAVVCTIFGGVLFLLIVIEVGFKPTVISNDVPQTILCDKMAQLKKFNKLNIRAKLEQYILNDFEFPCTDSYEFINIEYNDVELCKNLIIVEIIFSLKELTYLGGRDAACSFKERRNHVLRAQIDLDGNIIHMHMKTMDGDFAEIF